MNAHRRIHKGIIYVLVQMNIFNAHTKYTMQNKSTYKNKVLKCIAYANTNFFL